ncbi:MAG: phosphodiester glycosidase family protein [Chloroherpetonaceae bacterium]|nr:phosphodiester glycosidase family protein [Chthonomonadaceae bacterium]MDW8207515.1 phosphodiester glycosidase family protein [Chloroherpetonaceae bacterium]
MQFGLSSHLIPRTLLIALLALPLPLRAQDHHSGRIVTSRPVAQGVELTQEIITGDTPLMVHILRVRLNVPGVRVRTGQAFDSISLQGPGQGREGVHTLARRHGAVAAINADFFPFTGDPLGLAIRDGELLSEPTPHRVCFGLTSSGQVRMDVLSCVATLRLANGTGLPLAGINRLPAAGEITVLTPTFTATPVLPAPVVVLALRGVNLPVRVSRAMRGIIATIHSLEAGIPLPRRTPEETWIVAEGKTGDALREHCQPGEPVHFQFDLTPSDPPGTRGRYASRASALRATDFTPVWKDVEQAVGGGPWLVRDGQIFVDGEAQGFNPTAFVQARHPRTAIGITAERHLLLVAVDGRQAASRGMSLPELAALMKRLGAVHAINLDGGGSTTLYAGGGIVNAPSDGRVRPVANALLVFGRPVRSRARPTYSIRRSGAEAPTSVVAGETLPLKLIEASGKEAPANLPVLWGTEDGLGFVTQQGVFTSYRAGKGQINARIGADVPLHCPVTVLPGPLAQIKATIQPGNDPNTGALTIVTQDRFGNPVPDQNVTVTFSTGRSLTLQTDARGQVSCAFQWQEQDTQITLSSGNAPSVTLRR